MYSIYSLRMNVHRSFLIIKEILYLTKLFPKPDMIIEECSEPTVEVSDIEMIEVSNATEVISMIELPEKTKILILQKQSCQL